MAKTKKKNKKKKGFKLERRKSYNDIYEQVLRIAPLVVKILEKDIKSRDDDNILLMRVWKKQGLKEKMTVKQFKYKLIMGKLGLAETIMRSRRMIQSDNEYAHLRGKLYYVRHKAEEEMRSKSRKNQLKLF